MGTQAAVIPLFYPVRLPEMEDAALSVLQSGQIAAGPNVAQFENEFGLLVGSDHVVTTSDMTSALVLALRLAGVQPGDEVATLAFSCLSSNSAISISQARAVWVDLDPETMSMCPQDLARKLGSTVKAVALYHVAGYPANTDEIATICRARGIPLIEDCNNALGATLHGQPVGQAGDFAVYSFYPNRQINGLEGGALVCPDVQTAQHARKLRRFGIDFSTFRDARGEINPDSDVPELGISAVFSQLNATVAISQLPTLAARQQRTKQNAARLGELLEGTAGIRLVNTVPGGSPAYWGLLLYVERRDQVLAALKSNGIQCSVLHQPNDTYSGFHSLPVDMPGTGYVLDHLLALPCGWWLDDDQITHIVNAVRHACQLR
ncbi:MAG: DegT/DnrJ/EryC1/StrS family aminotransferase [Rhodoferax sp.]|uniref:DegT/DnrJ/EryC1/StrS family aminotransferase n=1 Tax=Rhodoferax sp. TaxID=50421 RepID=UPI002ACE042D|nr:DegT/DnrJ/EryC1/StrS family aminotransferase [Rhodoferax sp.]MDZ7892208.1 DegT/DnrJ/EryC1/StrS family aminotransferase [Rhodoferax sp.]